MNWQFWKNSESKARSGDIRETDISSQEYKPTHASFAEFLFTNHLPDLAMSEAIRLYSHCSPLFKAIDMRAEGFASIPTKAKDGDDFVDNGLVDLINNPNGEQTGVDFKYQLSSLYDATGNVFLLAFGNVDREPLELFVVGPQNIAANVDQSVFIGSIVKDYDVVGHSGMTKKYTAEFDNKTRTMRYISDDRLSELYHIRFTSAKDDHVFAMPKAQPIWLDVQQYISGSKNNLSKLNRGNRADTAWVNNKGEGLSDIQWARLKEQATLYAGSESAGKQIILDGMDVKAISASNRDMEFSINQTAMIKNIANIYAVPLAKVLDTSMTLDNTKTAKLDLYDDAILPLTARLNANITKALMPRYNTDAVLTVDEAEIPALAGRVIERTRDLGAIGINTIDELRTQVGFEGLADGGDFVYRPANEIPIGTDTNTDDERTQAAKIRKIVENG